MGDYRMGLELSLKMVETFPKELTSFKTHDLNRGLECQKYHTTILMVYKIHAIKNQVLSV